MKSERNAEMIETILTIAALIGGPAAVVAIFKYEAKMISNRPMKPLY
jgi:hypothetical protein